MTTLIRSNIFSFRKSFVAADILLYQKIKKIMKCNVTSTSDPHPLGLEANLRNSQLITFHSDLRSAAHSEHQLGEIKPIGQNSQMHSSYVHITAMHVSGRSSPRTKLCICYLWTHAAETRTKSIYEEHIQGRYLSGRGFVCMPKVCHLLRQPGTTRSPVLSPLVLSPRLDCAF